MSGVKHTPVLRSSMKDGRIYETDFGPCVAQVFFVDDRPPSDFLKRLALFAAAPDLLEAAEEFCRRVEAGEIRSKRSYAAFKAAIARARGEQSPNPSSQKEVGNG